MSQTCCSTHLTNAVNTCVLPCRLRLAFRNRPAIFDFFAPSLLRLRNGDLP